VRIFITAIGGFLGDALAGHLRARGHEVTGSTRRTMELGRPFDSTIFERQDAVLHCAHDFMPGAHDRNVAGSKAWMETGASLGVRRQIFLSSHAARPDAAGEYARTKYEIERLFLDSGFTVLRPGLVTGAGGLYARQRAALLRTPVVPMVGTGAQLVATISLADFLTAATIVLEEERTGAFNLFYQPMPTYREFVRGVREGRPTLFLPVPIGLALGLAHIAEWLRLPVPVKPGQIRSLVTNTSSPWCSDLLSVLQARTNRRPASGS
jgi:nucleoside-diphosphate-sugar epimerase